MTLREKQSTLVQMIAQLIQWAYANGYELTFGDAYRDPRVFGAPGDTKGYGQPYSNHKLRLAVDFNLFRNDMWLQKTEDFRPLGEFWESIGGTWGGRFGDGNHFSLQHQGRK